MDPWHCLARRILGCCAWAILIAAAPPLAGCSVHPAILPNPISGGGQVAPNRAEAPDRTDENAYSLPDGTLNSEAVLVSLDRHEACFRVTLRAVGDRQELASLGGWTAKLQAEPDFVGTVASVRSVAEVSVRPVHGQIVDFHTAGVRSRGMLRSRTGTVVSYQIGDLPILTGGGVICFTHNGQLSGATRELSLVFEDPHPLWLIKRSVLFVWRFTKPSQG